MQEGAFTAGEVAVFEGVEQAREAVSAYYERKIRELAAKEAKNPHATQEDLDHEVRTQQADQRSQDVAVKKSANGHERAPRLPEGRKLYTSESIIDRKSVFVGHAIELHHPSEVSSVVVSDVWGPSPNAPDPSVLRITYFRTERL